MGPSLIQAIKAYIKLSMPLYSCLQEKFAQYWESKPGKRDGFKVMKSLRGTKVKKNSLATFALEKSDWQLTIRQVHGMFNLPQMTLRLSD